MLGYFALNQVVRIWLRLDLGRILLNNIDFYITISIVTLIKILGFGTKSIE